MPLPSPQKKEEQSEFISRCMGDETMLKEYPDQKQRAAICYSQFRRAKKGNQAKGSKDEPKWDEFSTKEAVIIL